MTSWRAIRVAVMGLAVMAAVCVLSGVPAWTADDLPKGDAILDKFVEVTGGKAAYDKVTSSIEKAKVEIVGQGMTLTSTSYNVAGKNYTKIESDAVGTIEQGINADFVWEKTTMSGPEIKEGAEAAFMRRSAALDGIANWRKYQTKAETVGLETIDSKPAYKVTVTAKDGAIETRYYDKESGLLVKEEMTLELKIGKIPIVGTMTDYKKEGDLLVPHKLTQVMAGTQQMAITIESVEYNKEIPAETFKTPADVQALYDKKQKEKTDADKPKDKPAA